MSKFQSIRLKYVQLQAQKNMVLMMHHTLIKILLSMEKMSVEDEDIGIVCTRPAINRKFHQFSDKSNLHKQVSNMQIEIYLMYLSFFSQTFIHKDRCINRSRRSCFHKNIRNKPLCLMTLHQVGFKLN